MIFETLGSVNTLEINESQNDGLMRLSGVFGVAGVKNSNNRIYDKNNYGVMVENLQRIIETKGCPGELEHPNSMNIDLNNVSHKIESIKMNEDGTITGTICLLDTPKGNIAKAIVKGGLPLYISSRGAGTVTNEGRVTLSTIKTYDLVGTPGFDQAQLNLDKNQKFENLNESLDPMNTDCWAIIESDDDNLDDLLSDDDDKKHEDNDKKKDDGEKKEKKKGKLKIKLENMPKDDEDDSDEDSDEDKDDESEKKTEKKTDKKEKHNNDIGMEELKKSIDELADKINSLEAELHVAKESLNDIRPVNYDAIQQWVTDEFATEFKEELSDELNDRISESVIQTVANGVQKWVTEEFAPVVQGWICEEFAPEVQNWICEEYEAELKNDINESLQNWVCEEFAPEVQNWIVEEYSPTLQNWVVEELSPVMESWMQEELLPANNEVLENKINSNVNEFFENSKADRLEHIDDVLEQLENANETNADLNKIIKEHNDETKYQGIYCVENMPAQYRASWNMLSESRQQEIIRTSRMYDFTKAEVLENFWAGVDFNKDEKQVSENKQAQADPRMNKLNNIAEIMRTMHLYR